MLVTGLAFGSVTANAQSNADERISAIDNTPSVRPSSGGIEITVQGESTSTFYIYSITGQMVKSVDISGSTFIDLPRGCYIIKSRCNIIGTIAASNIMLDDCFDFDDWPVYYR